MAQDYSLMGFLSGLLDAMKEGAKNTGYAVSEDVSDVKEGKLPANLMRDLPGLLSMFQSGAVNPQIPALQYTTKVFDPDKGWIDQATKIAPGGNWLEMFSRQGGFGQLISQLLSDYEKNK